MPFILVKNDEEEEIILPITEHPIMLTFPAFATPSKVNGKHIEGISIRTSYFYNFGKPVEEVLKEHGAENYRVTETSRPVALARLLAKIAWGIAVVSGHRKRLDPALKDSFLYFPDTIGQWVGTYTDPLEKSEKTGAHEINIREDHKTGFLMGDVKLFSHLNTPQYGVILGQLENDQKVA